VLCVNIQNDKKILFEISKFPKYPEMSTVYSDTLGLGLWYGGGSYIAAVHVFMGPLKSDMDITYELAGADQLWIKI